MQVNEAGQAVYTEGQLDYLTTRAKVRPARGAFGDWNAYDADGNPTVVVLGSSTVVSEMDDLANNWGYATQTEQRSNERGDEPEADPTQYAWFARKGDRVEVRTERTPYNTEKVFSNLPGYHLVSEGNIQCWYCAKRFDCAYLVRQDREVSRNLMEHFAIEAMLHTTECKAEHNGLPLIRQIGYNGKPRHWRVSQDMASTKRNAAGYAEAGAWVGLAG